MQRLIFQIVYPIIIVVSKLPFSILYRISDVLFFCMYYVIGYRKKLVYQNIKTFFPEKSHADILKIRRMFYHHFCDLMIETLKTFTISPKELDKHFTLSNTEVLDRLAAKKQSVIVMGSHYGNWEWTIKVGQNSEFQPIGIFAKINNPFFSDKIKQSRERFGMKLVMNVETTKTVINNYKKGILSIYGFLSDQSPVLERSFYWTQFLGKRVPVFTGAETLAKKYNHALVFIAITKKKRGNYNAAFQLITDSPHLFSDYELTEQFLKLTEAQIRQKPEHYLWSHNRFKLEGKEQLSPAMK